MATDAQIFQDYLEFRIGKAGALTPGQKLEVVRQLKQEARDGVIPSGPNSVVRVPLNSPAVQAVLRGEPISVGSTVVRNKTGLQNLSTPQKLALLGGGMLVWLLIAVILVMMFRSPKVEPQPTATIFVTETFVPTDTSTPEPSQTPVPSETPTETPAPALFSGVGSPGEDANAPASLELKGRLFILQQGKVDEKSGVWSPQGPEWLNGTEVRRVLALPIPQVQDLPVQPGDAITLRTRNGRVVVYPITQMLNLTPDQIEAFMSLSPSIIVTLFDQAQSNNPAAQRPVLIGELSGPPQTTATPYLIHAVINTDANLRAEPSTQSAVLAGLATGTAVTVPYPYQTKTGNKGAVWIFVNTSLGNGWVIRSFLSFNQP